MRQYARQSRQGLEMQNRCAEIKLRAERRAGEMLADVPRAKPGPDPEVMRQDGAQPGYRETIADADIPEQTARRWQAVAAVPSERFEAHLQATKDAGEELTTAGLLRAATGPHVLATLFGLGSHAARG